MSKSHGNLRQWVDNQTERKSSYGGSVGERISGGNGLDRRYENLFENRCAWVAAL